ncbi:NAD(P)-dependent oxidoreductase [Psychrobacillus soli]|uniref:NAD-dependent epimerase/dehydratase family protein n=1 Tax=Psychrobacillus soli TaxID=1543965 RepID=A0A544TK38_9BACI|nr:NAD(P)H-binding protein [Psychrobacillus soli]TQR17802.1 NAD-dependent epimerase/dehydratase family protein [Psychrobacillus soli]
MKIALFGATGRVGRDILLLLLQNNIEVTALVRDSEKVQPHDRLTVLQGDARLAMDIERTLENADAVISALGTDQTTVLTESISHIIIAMKKQKIHRIITIGTAGILTSRVEPELLRYESSESKQRSKVAAKEHHRVFHMLSQSSLDWTIVCPTYLPTGVVTNAYIIERDMLPVGATRTTTGDTAVFAYNELIENKHIGYRVGIMSPE